MNEVHNRVPSKVLPNGAVRIEEFDEAGRSLGYRWVKRADEPLVDGTRIDRALFQSIMEENLVLSSLADCQVEIFKRSGVTSSFTYVYQQRHVGTPVVLAVGSAEKNMLSVTDVTDKQCTIAMTQPSTVSSSTINYANVSQTVYGIVISGREL